jgi:hypothetical protein
MTIERTIFLAIEQNQDYMREKISPEQFTTIKKEQKITPRNTSIKRGTKLYSASNELLTRRNTNLAPAMLYSLTSHFKSPYVNINY